MAPFTTPLSPVGQVFTVFLVLQAARHSQRIAAERTSLRLPRLRLPDAAVASRGGSGPAVPPAARSEAFASVYTRRSRNRFDDLAPLRSRVLPPNATARGAGAMDDTQSLASARWAEQLAATGTGPPDEAAPEGMWRTHKFRERFALKEGRVLQDDRYWSNVKQAHRERGEVWAPPRLTHTAPPGCCVRVEAVAGWLADRPPPAACPVLSCPGMAGVQAAVGEARRAARVGSLQSAAGLAGAAGRRRGTGAIVHGAAAPPGAEGVS